MTAERTSKAHHIQAVTPNAARTISKALARP
jgi:hypothetical protein